MKSESPKLLSKFSEQGETKCRLVFGPDGSYCAWRADKDWGHDGRIPDHVHKTSYERGRIDVVALGVDFSYFFLQADGKSWYDLKGNYTALQEIMVDLRNGDIEVLHPAMKHIDYLIFD